MFFRSFCIIKLLSVLQMSASDYSDIPDPPDLGLPPDTRLGLPPDPLDHDGTNDSERRSRSWYHNQLEKFCIGDRGDGTFASI